MNIISAYISMGLAYLDSDLDSRVWYYYMCEEITYLLAFQVC